ncbi:hypothetical protein [Risungbinella massiliensis]|uniref:hypothetical protein n=1 Tax=Risungbinella massiliensis TaxID=1329796 RepID=UPI001E4978A9|nr:hypothetical protein [Risungbinella massiliensis]
MNQRHMNNLDHFAKHGGVHFSLNVPEEQINQYVSKMSKEQRESMYNVMNELEKAGYITIANDGVFADGEGEIGGSIGCHE